MTDTERLVPGCLFLSLSALTFAAIIALSGCGSTPQQNAQRTVDGIGVAVNITDIAFAQVYAARARAALDAAADLVAYRTAMTPFDAGVTALRTARAALEVGDATVRIWDQGGVSSWPQALSCIIGALVGVRDVLAAAGVDLPPELTAAIDTARGLADPDSCFVDAGLPGGA